MDSLTESELKERFSEAMNSATAERAAKWARLRYCPEVWERSTTHDYLMAAFWSRELLRLTAGSMIITYPISAQTSHAHVHSVPTCNLVSG